MGIDKVKTDEGKVPPSSEQAVVKKEYLIPTESLNTTKRVDRVVRETLQREDFPWTRDPLATGKEGLKNSQQTLRNRVLAWRDKLIK